MKPYGVANTPSLRTVTHISRLIIFVYLFHIAIKILSYPFLKILFHFQMLIRAHTPYLVFFIILKYKFKKKMQLDNWIVFSSKTF